MDSTSDLKVEVEPASGVKCPRCWRFVPEVCNLGICERCVVACQEDGIIRPVSKSKADWAAPKKRGQFEFVKEVEA